MKPREKVNYNEECPWCGKDLDDLWDYDWRGRSFIEVKCPHCGKSIGIEADTAYIISVLDDEET